MKEEKKYKSYAMILYPQEDISHKQAIEYIKDNFQYALIKHDKDKNEDGTPKKEHTHIVIKFKCARYKKPVAEEIGIEENYIKNCKLENYLLYLIHANAPEKHQYKIDEVEGPLKTRIKEILNNTEETNSEKVKIIVDNLMKNNLNIIDLTYLTIENGLYETLKNNIHVISKIIAYRDAKKEKLNNKKKN